MNDYPKYFVLGDGQPGRQPSPGPYYEVLGSSGWRLTSPWEFIHDAQPVSEDEFNQAVRDWTNPQPATPPAATPKVLKRKTGQGTDEELEALGEEIYRQLAEDIDKKPPPSSPPATS